MKKLIAALVALFIFTVSAEAKVYQHLKTVAFHIPDAQYTIEYDGKEYAQQTFHYAAFAAAVKLSRAYFKVLDPKFDIDNFYLTIKVDYSIASNWGGSYDWNVISVQSYDHTQNGGYTLFGRKLNYKHYVGVVVHEIAHAILHQRSAYIDHGGHEYFAYCVLFDVMGYELVEWATKKFGRVGFDNTMQISLKYYDKAPQQFAVRAYWHRAQDKYETFFLIWNGRFKSYKRPGPGE